MKRKAYFVLVSLILITNIQSIHCQSNLAQAQSIFTYNFTRLIEWPSDFKSGDFVIGVYGTSEVFSEIKKYMSGKSVGAQPILIRKIADLEDIGKCHILFVSFGKCKEIPAIVAKIGSNKTLIIAEKKGSLEDGAAINFTIVDDKLKYEMKASNLTKMGLKYNSNLENMAIAKH